MPVTILNRQRTRLIDTRQLRRILRTLLDDQLHLKAYELGITLVAAPEMTRLNETYLRHSGSTDVITFDHSKPGTWNSELGTAIHGELFVCVDEAVLQAKRFHTTWQSEIVRYIVHGVLHLLGHDDHQAADRRRMKRKENRLLWLLAAQFGFKKNDWVARPSSFAF